MPRMTTLLATLAAAAMAFPAAAQAPAQAAPATAALFGGEGPIEFKDPSNAALLYYKVWMEVDYRDFQKLCGEELKSGDPLWKPSPELTTNLEEHNDMVRRLIRASEAPTADFGIEFSQGINAILPHLGYMRGSARILACDARRCMVEGDMDSACERIAAMYRMARHCTNDRVLISSLVSVAITALANTQTQQVIDANRLTAEGKRLLMAEITALSAPDGWSVKRSAEGERWWTVGWLRTFATGPDAGKKIVDQIIPLMGAELDSDIAKEVSAMNESQMASMLDQAAGYYDEVLKAWDTPDAAQQLRTLESKVESGEYGVIGKMLAPAFGKCYQSEIKARAELAAIRNKLEYHIPIGR